MPRGGARPGAGRKAGGTNRKTIAWDGQLLADPASAESPLAYLLRQMRDERVSLKSRIEAAVAAAPYVHAMPSGEPENASLPGWRIVSDATAESPRAFLLAVMNNRLVSERLRNMAARGAARYCHARPKTGSDDQASLPGMAADPWKDDLRIN